MKVERLKMPLEHEISASGVMAILDGYTERKDTDLPVRVPDREANTDFEIDDCCAFDFDHEEMIRKAAARAGMSKTAYILEAIDEKLGIAKDREQLIRELAGWMSHEEAEELRQSLEVFEEIHEGDWP
jgi:hypothetical protein